MVPNLNIVFNTIPMPNFTMNTNITMRFGVIPMVRSGTMGRCMIMVKLNLGMVLNTILRLWIMVRLGIMVKYDIAWDGVEPHGEVRDHDEVGDHGEVGNGDDVKPNVFV